MWAREHTAATETLYDVTSFGFIQKNFDTIVNGLAQSIIIADSRLQPANIKIQNGTLLNTSAKCVMPSRLSRLID